jgi:uncharacterized protein YndB with AHSA1/START domain
MPTESVELAWTLPVPPGDIYRAWLDSEAHGQFTGGAASVAPGVGGQFTAWDGYIRGTTLELEPDKRIVQAWRTTEFPSGSADSRLELHLEKAEEGTRVTLRHTEIPEGQGETYRRGWDEFYIQPMTRYFGARSSRANAPALETTSNAPASQGSARKAATKKAAAKKGTAKKAAAKKSTVKKSAAKKGTAKKGTAKKGTAKKSAAKKSAAKKGAARKGARQRSGQKRKR